MDRKEYRKYLIEECLLSPEAAERIIREEEEEQEEERTKKIRKRQKNDYWV